MSYFDNISSSKIFRNFLLLKLSVAVRFEKVRSEKSICDTCDKKKFDVLDFLKIK